ncbi:hypothetical protein [Maricaulis sp.]
MKPINPFNDRPASLLVMSVETGLQDGFCCILTRAGLAGLRLPP